MEMKECIDTILLLLDDHGELFDDGEKKALNKLVNVAEAVEKWRGKLPVKQECEHIPNEDMTHFDCCEVNKMLNRMREDCAAAYVANIPTVEEIKACVEKAKWSESQKMLTTHDGIADITGAVSTAVHDLLVGKVRK